MRVGRCGFPMYLYRLFDIFSFFVLTSRCFCDIILSVVSGCGAVGSALPWGGRGRWFKSSHSDQISTVVLIRNYRASLFA